MAGFLLHLIPSLITPVLKHRGFTCARILLEWETIVGAEFAHHCCPDRIYFPKGQKKEGTLYLIMDPSSAFRFEYIKDLITERINAYFGYKAVSHIKVFQKPFKRKNPGTASVKTKDEAIIGPSLFPPIAHEGLQKALEKYGQSLHKALASDFLAQAQDQKII